MGVSTAPYLARLPEDVSQRKHELREVFHGPHYLVTICRRTLSRGTSA